MVKTAELSQRLYIYVYSLLYPAVLGSFLFGFLIWKCPRPGHLYVAALMGIYFLVQFGEGMARGAPKRGVHRYGCHTFTQDLLEIAALVWVFASLGFFDVSAPGRMILFDDQLWVAMAAAFAIPPLFRTFRARPGPDVPAGRDAQVGGSLSLMSLVATLASLAGYIWPGCRFWAGAIITALLFLYLICFVLKPGWGASLEERRKNPFGNGEATADPPSDGPAG